MRTVTGRLLEEDLDRARVLGAVQHQPTHQVIHAALDEYVARHRAELEGLFANVQQAVLRGDKGALRAAFVEEADRRAADDIERIGDLWDS